MSYTIDFTAQPTYTIAGRYREPTRYVETVEVLIGTTLVDGTNVAVKINLDHPDGILPVDLSDASKAYRLTFEEVTE